MALRSRFSNKNFFQKMVNFFTTHYMKLKNHKTTPFFTAGFPGSEFSGRVFLKKRFNCGNVY